MNIYEITKKHLETIGADGLYNDTYLEEDCGCCLPEIIPCDGQYIEGCVPVKKVPRGEDIDNFEMVPDDGDYTSKMVPFDNTRANDE